MLSGLLYIWVANTMRSGGISRRVTPPIETEFPEKKKSQEIEEKKEEKPKTEKENQKEQISEEKIKTFQYQRQELSFLKFISSENCLYSLDDSEVQKLKSLNINGIRICPLYSLGKDGSIKEEIPEFFFTNLIKKAHQEGFAVFLDINVGGIPTETGEPARRYDNPKYINDLYEISLYWAKIAEEEKVEFFSPLNEPNLMFVNEDLANQWIEKAKDLKSVFFGNLVLKFADIGPEKIENINGYDYLAFDIMWGDARYQELRDHLKRAIEKGNNLKQQYGLKGFFFGELGAERSRVSKDVQAEIFKTIFQETWGKVDGYCFLGWSNLEFSFRDNEKAIEIIKTWYSKI